MRQATTEQLWNLDNASLKVIDYSLNRISQEGQLKEIMARVKFPYDEISETYSEAENTKSKTNCEKPKICKNNSIDSDTSTNDSTSDDTAESYCPPTYSNSFGDIIEQIKKLRFIRTCSKAERKLSNSREKSNSTESMDNNSKDDSELTSDDALNSNYCKQYYQVNMYDDKKDKENDEESLNTDLDNQSDDEGDDDDDGNLIERGPVRPQLNAIRSKPYDTLDWLLQSDNYPPDRQQSEPSDYETSIQQLLTDTDYRERLDSCLDQLSDSNKKSPVFNENLDPNQRQKFDNVQQSMTYSSAKTPPAIFVNNPEGTSLLDILARGGFQAAQVFSDCGTTNGSSPGMNSEAWPDSPASSYNVISSRPNSRASSRAQSPGSAVMPINIASSPAGSSQISLSFRSPHGFSSSSSSNQSYCETPSPANYHSPLDSRSEDQLDERFNRFVSWQESNESSGTIVNTAELIDAIDSNELQLVEEVVLKELSRKGCNLEEMQVVPNSQLGFRKFESHGSGQSPRDNESRSSLDSDHRVANDVKNERTDMNFFSDSLNFGSTGSIINEAQQSLVYPKSGDGFDLVYSENQSPVGSYREKMSPANNYVGNPSPNNRYIDKSSPVSLEIDATIENIIANYSKTNNGESTNDTMNFDMHLFECAKSTCPTYNVPTVQNHQHNLVSQSPSTSTFNEFQVPEVLRRHSRRHVAPWSSLNLPSTKACDKLIEELNPKDVERAMASLLKKTSEELAKPDKDGDTMLMCLAGNPDELMKKKAYLLPLVERLSTVQSALSVMNNRGEDALYLMAINCPQMAYVTGYLAATMLQKGIHVGQKLYQPGGETLIHVVAAKGDSHEAVLAELLSLKTIRGNAVFNVLARNYEGKTALHLAVESHDPIGRGVNSISTVRLLLKNGADLLIKEAVRGDAALHSAVFSSCDPILIKALLERNSHKDNLYMGNYSENSSMLMSTMCNGVKLERNIEVCKLFLENGGKPTISNGHAPMEYLPPDRKNSIKPVFHCRSKIH